MLALLPVSLVLHGACLTGRRQRAAAASHAASQPSSDSIQPVCSITAVPAATVVAVAGVLCDNTVSEGTTYTYIYTYRCTEQQFQQLMSSCGRYETPCMDTCTCIQNTGTYYVPQHQSSPKSSTLKASSTTFSRSSQHVRLAVYYWCTGSGTGAGHAHTRPKEASAASSGSNPACSACLYFSCVAVPHIGPDHHAHAHYLMPPSSWIQYGLFAAACDP